jgi:hypothetical protein
MASNEIQDFRDAKTPQEAADAYGKYVASQLAAGQKPKDIRDL